MSWTSICVHVLVCLFGIGSWIDINGVWVELPVMVQYLPEGWSLGSYLVIIIQLANIGPLVVTLVTVFMPSKMKESAAVYAILIVGALACLLLAFLWQQTSLVSGVEHSVALLVLQFFLALVDCTSSVVFLPFMSVFKEQYMTTYFIGEGLSGLLPSLVALVQGAGAVRCVRLENLDQNTSRTNSEWVNETAYSVYPEFLPPRFPVRTFFIFLFFMMVACCTAFIILNHHPFCRSEKVFRSETKYEVVVEVKTNGVELEAYHKPAEDQNGIPFNPSEDVCTTGLMSVEGRGDPQDGHIMDDPLGCPIQDIQLSRCMYFYYLLLTGWMNGMTNAVLPSLQTYSCIPYGLGPYHLAVIFASISNPLACFVAVVLPTKSNSIISTIALTGSLLSSYIITLAALSPVPFLKSDSSGGIIMIVSWVLTILSLSYAKVTIAAIFRIEGKKALLWCGAATQIGSALGAIIMFVLINVSKVFQSAPMCS
ncbi:solute carrier family 52, riboflavin transporter, member 3-B-like [Liolophura sinensis]|uniref:solute carrier family 52, riboflavin transporter, member 3-B-like n=1 Tax=Liolophura sinensis TaxID=3198878 RepID=UPI00315850E9